MFILQESVNEGAPKALARAAVEAVWMWRLMDRRNQQYEQIIASDKENQLTIQTLKSSMERLRSDLESEVNNNEKLNNALTVSKALVDNLNTKYADAIEQVNKNAKISVDHDKTSKALKKAKEEIARLTNKTEELLKTISKLLPLLQSALHQELLLLRLLKLKALHPQVSLSIADMSKKKNTYKKRSLSSFLLNISEESHKCNFSDSGSIQTT